VGREQDATHVLIATGREVEPRLTRLDETFIAQARAAQEEGVAAAAFMGRLVLLSIGGIVVIVGCLCWLVGRGIARPIIAVTRAMEALGHGELDAPIPTDHRRDEIGTMVQTVQAFKDSLVHGAQLRAGQVTADAEAQTAKRGALSAMADRIESESGQSIQLISDQTGKMTLTAEKMGKLAARVGQSAESATEAAGIALANAQTVASAAEQLAASIREISGQVNHSNATVDRAVAASTATQATIEALNERVGKIGAVAEIISDIAAKTNLLALNATIEAARAGEAGRGFAVVAGEVKQLANQTARSTEEINRHITDVRSATAHAVAAVAGIATMIGEVNSIAGSIAAAVEEQGTATAEIARGVTATATAISGVNTRNAEVAKEAGAAGRHASEVLDGTRTLDHAIGELKRALIRTVRTSTAEVDRRVFQREDIDLPGQLEIPGGGSIASRVGDLSEGGARLAGTSGLRPGTRGTLRLGGLAPMAFTVRSIDDMGIHVAFEMDDAGRQALRAYMARVHRQAA
jgi:methyl-accepting chemotaxis protein